MQPLAKKGVKKAKYKFFMYFEAPKYKFFMFLAITELNQDAFDSQSSLVEG